MKASPEACCIVCQLVFCCADCRWKHESTTHGLLFDCQICRGNRFLCRPEDLTPPFLKHLSEEHLPLQCRKCNQIFTKMEDFVDINKCTSVSEIVADPDNSKTGTEIDKKFDSLYEKVNNDGDNFEAIVSVNKASKTAVITPVVRKKHLVDYESSDTESEDSPKKGMRTPHPKLSSKISKLKRQRAATPHVKKMLNLMRQEVVEEYEESVDDPEKYNELSINSKTTPSRNTCDVVPGSQKEMTTPTSHIPHIMKLAQAVTTSTPTHPALGGWSIFPGQGADSPLSEIENAESPAQSIGTEPSSSKVESEVVPPKLKSIIVTGSRLRLGSQDSSEKTVQESMNNTEASVKTKKVKFADDTVFEQEAKVKRVFRKPRRMLTPGPQRPKFCYNPRFQALINRFENQGLTLARTPVNANRENKIESSDTPPVSEHSNKPARAINFKEDSRLVESENYSKESNELFKTCVDSPVESVGLNNAITALTANIAGSLQNCLSTALGPTEEETEIQFKFVITKKKVSVKRVDLDGVVDEELNEVNIDTNKENIWSTVARAVRNVFWGEQESYFATTTPHRLTNDSTSSSASKRKCDELSDVESSPLHYKRHKYEGRIRGRPPLRRSKTWGVSNLRSSHSAEQHSLIKEITLSQDDAMNQSF